MTEAGVIRPRGSGAPTGLQPVAIPSAWAHLPFFHDEWPSVAGRLGEGWLPGPARVFAALEAVAPADVRVVILGQDPYPTPGHADGLAFSVAPGVALPRSLRNIFAEMRDDLGAAPAGGNLAHWATQVVAEAQRHGPLAFVLWGGHAQAALKGASRPGDLVVESAHPSPLSARRGFFGSRPFSRVNDWLAAHRPPVIDWIGPRPAGQLAQQALL